MTKRWMLRGGMAAAMLALCAGCEKTATGNMLKVTPETSEIVVSNNVQITELFKAEGVASNQVVYLPLVWTVSDQSLGFMRDASGYTAVYEARDAKGVNTITVRDQIGAEGLAIVTQTKAD